MKTLKICRLVSSVALTICYMMFVIPKLVNNDPNLVLIASVALLVIGLPISLIARMKNEKNPSYLAKTEMGMIYVEYIVPVLMIGFFIFGIIMEHVVGRDNIWLVMTALFAGIYSACNNTILYKAKKAYDAENTIKNS